MYIVRVEYQVYISTHLSLVWVEHFIAVRSVEALLEERDAPTQAQLSRKGLLATDGTRLLG